MSGTRRVYEIRDVGGVCGGVWVCERSRSACDEVASVWRCRGCVMCSECGAVVCVCGLWCMWSVSLFSLSVIFYMFLSSEIGRIVINKCYIFLLHDSLYHYVVSLSIFLY